MDPAIYSRKQSTCRCLQERVFLIVRVLFASSLVCGRVDGMYDHTTDTIPHVAAWDLLAELL